MYSTYIQGHCQVCLIRIAYLETHLDFSLKQTWYPGIMLFFFYPLQSIFICSLQFALLHRLDPLSQWFLKLVNQLNPFCLISNLRENLFSFSPLTIIVAIFFWLIYHSKDLPFITWFSNKFYHKLVFHFLNCFSALFEWKYEFLSFINYTGFNLLHSL